MDFAPICPHEPIEAIAEDLFMVRGSIRLNPITRISRNMAVVRHGDELTLVNPLRLDERELGRLDSLGAVKHVLRLGAMHGQDDPFYMDRYRPIFWCQEGGTLYSKPAIDRVLSEGGELPFSNAKLFCFRATKEPESALLLETGGPFLLTTDAIQHYGDFSQNNLLARLVMPWMGFSKTTLVGPLWLKMMTPEGGSLRDDFERLLSLHFDGLLSAHGTLLGAGAHEAVSKAVSKAFPGA